MLLANFRRVVVLSSFLLCALGSQAGFAQEGTSADKGTADSETTGQKPMQGWVTKLKVDGQTHARFLAFLPGDLLVELKMPNNMKGGKFRVGVFEKTGTEFLVRWMEAKDDHLEEISVESGQISMQGENEFEYKIRRDVDPSQVGQTYRFRKLNFDPQTANKIYHLAKLYHTTQLIGKTNQEIRQEEAEVKEIDAQIKASRDRVAKQFDQMDKLVKDLNETNQKIREAQAKVDQQADTERGTRRTESNTVEQAVLKLEDREIAVTFVYLTDSLLVELRDQKGRRRSVRFGLYTLKDQQMEIRWLKLTGKTKPPELGGRERGKVRFGWVGRNYTIQEHPDPTLIGKSLNFMLMNPLDEKSFQVLKTTAIELRQRYFESMEKRVRARGADLRKEWERMK